MSDTPTEQDSDTFRRILRVLVVLFVTTLLTSVNEQNSTFMWELSVTLGLMSAFQSMFLIVKIVLIFLIFEIILPGSRFLTAVNAFLSS